MSTFDTDPPESGDGPIRSRPGPSPVRRFFMTRVPLWVLLVVAAAIGMTLSVLLVVQQASAIKLNPVVGAAEQVDMRILVCNNEVDRLAINPRAAELELEALFQDEGAGMVDVAVERRDCVGGSVVTTTRGATTTTARVP